MVDAIIVMEQVDVQIVAELDVNNFFFRVLKFHKILYTILCTQSYILLVGQKFYKCHVTYKI